MQQKQAQKVMCIKKNSESVEFVRALQAKVSKSGLEDSNFLEGMFAEAAKAKQSGKEEDEWLFCPCEWTGTETTNLENSIKQITMKEIITKMQNVFTKGDPMEIHHHMAVAYAHFVPGFLETSANVTRRNGSIRLEAK